jgi:methylene-tetrahydromethanopterin dehydrogenase
MSKPYILHMLTATKNVSPFDVNMACDAGWGTIIPYLQVETDEVAALVQDAIFSRGPKGVKRTGVFIGGRDANLAMDMVQLAREAMVPPFEVSVFADPSGAFTTAAGLVACAEKTLKDTFDTSFAGQRVLVFGGSGPVGAVASVLAARAGADVRIVSHRSDTSHADGVAADCNRRYDVSIGVADGSSEALKAALLADTDVIFGTAKAGVQVLSAADLRHATALKVAGDLNAVPPLGIEGVGLMDNGKLIEGMERAVGIGALAVGNVKYQVQQGLFKDMIDTAKPVYLGFQHSFEKAREYVSAA